MKIIVRLIWDGVYRSSHPDVFCQKGILKNFAKFTGKRLSQSLFLNKVAGLGQVAASVPRKVAILRKKAGSVQGCSMDELFSEYKNLMKTPVSESNDELSFIKKRIQHRCFPAKFVKFSRASCCRTTRLLLKYWEKDFSWPVLSQPFKLQPYKKVKHTQAIAWMCLTIL